VRAFRSGMLLLAFVGLGIGSPAGAQTAPSSPADQQKPPASAVPPPASEDPVILPSDTVSAADAGNYAPPGDVTPQSKPVKKKGGLDFWSPEREQRMGERLDAQMQQSVTLLYAPPVTGYLEDLTARLVRTSEISRPVTLRVVESSAPDSFSLPGGFIYISAGMIQQTRTEAELAALLSHEVAHVACRHATRQMTKQQTIAMVAVPLALFGGPAALAVGEALSFSSPFAMGKFSRMAEDEADLIGLSYMNAVGYDPTAAISLFERIASQEKSDAPGFRRLAARHPLDKDRINAMIQAIAKLPAREESVVSTSQYDEMVGQLTRMGYKRESASPMLVRHTRDEDVQP